LAYSFPATIKIHEIALFFKLPSMRSLSAHRLVESEYTFEIPLGSSPITSIELTHSNCFYGMVGLITACANVKSFKYEHGDLKMPRIMFRPADIHRAAASTKNSLESLWIGDASNCIQRDELIGSLASFAVLRDIHIRLPNLLNVNDFSLPPTVLIDLLPASLESLHLSHVGNVYLSALSPPLITLVIESRTRMPRFAKLAIDGYFPGQHRQSTELQILQQAELLHFACISAGIEFAISIHGSIRLVYDP
jgi:hypothetical protein